jgi:hypothetical protein
MKISEQDYINRKIAAALSKDTNRFELIELSKDSNKFIRLELAKRNDIPEPVLLKFAENKNEAEEVKVEAAINHCSTEAVLLILIKDKSELVRSEVLANPNVTESVLEISALDKNEDIRLATSLHNNATPKILDSMFKENSDELEIRMSLSMNQKTSIGTLQLLMKDKEPLIAKMAEDNLHFKYKVKRIEDMESTYVEPKIKIGVEEANEAFSNIAVDFNLAKK